MYSLILAWMLARPWMAAPKCLEKSQATKLLLHLFFHAPESFYGPLEVRHKAQPGFIGDVPGWWCPP